jgi:FKBP-type peptidyl-prolyl cis-trans isomerase 2
MFAKYQRNPEVGDIVRCIRFGDHYHRTGKVTTVLGGVAVVDFNGTVLEMRVHRNDLEVWVPDHMTLRRS